MLRRAIHLAFSPGTSPSGTNDMGSRYRARSRRSIALLRGSIEDYSSGRDGRILDTECSPFSWQSVQMFHLWPSTGSRGFDLDQSLPSC
jgi:hypothetical protein